MNYIKLVSEINLSTCKSKILSINTSLLYNISRRSSSQFLKSKLNLLKFSESKIFKNSIHTYSTLIIIKPLLNSNNKNNNNIWKDSKRKVSKYSNSKISQGKLNTTLYFIAMGILMVGATYAGVPLYRLFCQKTGLGGELKRNQDSLKIEEMKPIKDRKLKIRFNADVASSMQWNFKPQQTEIEVSPGETALAFYKAKNPTDRPVIGISTYNVVPYEAGPYFNKIQCFCFEEQRLNPHEEVDMPVFFFIDPDYCKDPLLESNNTITLSYTFFEAKEGLILRVPSFASFPQNKNT